MIVEYQPNRPGLCSTGARDGRYAHCVTTVDLRTLRLRPGEVRKETLDVELEPFVLGGQRYEAVPATIPVDAGDRPGVGRDRVRSCGSSAHLTGAVHALPRLRRARLPGSRARVPRLDAPVGGRAALRLRRPNDHLQLSAWARDAVALELPEQILCRADCAGLCPVCGKDLNVEPHEHLERDPDPRWAALEGLERPS